MRHFWVALATVLAALIAAAQPLIPTATPAPAATPAPVPMVSNATLQGINAERASAGLRPLRESPELFRLAGARVEAQVACECVSHEGFGEAVAAYAPPAARVGENLARIRLQPDDASRVVGLWMASEAHRAQILTANYTRFAIAERTDVRAGAHYYVLIFATD